MRVLAIIEATTITGPAKNLIRVASLAKHPPEGEPAVDIAIATFVRPPGAAESPLIERARAAGIQVHVVPERAAFDPSVMRSLKDIVAEQNPDILQTHGVKSHFLARVAGLDRGRTWIAFHHGYTAVDRKMLAYNQLDRWSLHTARRVVTVCRPFADELAAKGVAQSRIEVLPNSIEPMPEASAQEIEEARRRFDLDANEHIILSIGRLSQEKGHIDLVAAAAELARARPEWRFRVLIAGEGPEHDRIARAAAPLGDRLFRLVGHVADVRPLFAAADIFVLPSYSEGSPNVLLEAMAAGTPIVATTVGGIPETVKNEYSALLVPPQDPAALAAAMMRFVDHPELQAELRRNGLQAVAVRSPGAYYRGLLKIYNAGRG